MLKLLALVSNKLGKFKKFLVIMRIFNVFVPHNPQGLTRQDWLDNLQFDGKLYRGKQFQVTEEYF